MVQKKLTVVQILPELEEGGVEGETLDLAIHLAQNGHNSIVISGGGRMVPILERHGCRHLLWPHIGEKSLRCLKYKSQLEKFFSEEQIDVIHLRSRLPAWLGYWAWKALPVKKRPALITTFHGFYSVNAYSTIMTKGEMVVAVSRTIQEHILEHYKVDPSKIRLIHGGFDEKAFSPECVDLNRCEQLKNKWGIQTNTDPIIILPGRLTLWKGQDVFIESLALIKDKPFLALCIGDTEENQAFTKKLLERVANLGLQDKVKFVGHCSDMPAALLLGDLVVSASSAQPEAFGKVAIEAMAMGKPVVATAHGGSLETIVDGKTGWLVEPQNPQKMAEAISKVLYDKAALITAGTAGKEWVTEHFTALSMCRKTLSLYQELVARKQRRQEKKPITVLQMLPELDGGGVERGTLEMGRFLAENGHNSLVVSASGRLVPQLEKEGSRHIPMRVGDKSPAVLAHLWPLRKIIQQEKVDILHLRSRMPAWVGYLVWKTLPKNNRPALITTFHGFYSVNSYSAIMTKGDAIIAVSRSIQQHILENYGCSKNVVLIFRGVDQKNFSPTAVSSERVSQLAEKWQIQSDKPVIMLPGRLTRLKGQEIFLQSLTMLKTSKYQAVLVGDTEDNPSFTAELNSFIHTNGLEDTVRLVGHCSDMAAAYLLADIVLSASSSEPEAFGRTTVEAMAMGKPVIATAHGGSLETVVHNETGWLIPPSDAAAMATAIDSVLALGRDKLHAIGLAGQERVNELFTTLSMCEKTLAVYRRYL